LTPQTPLIINELAVSVWCQKFWAFFINSLNCLNINYLTTLCNVSLFSTDTELTPILTPSK